MSGSTLATTVTGLTNNTTYTFKVAANTASGAGAPSAATSAVTPQKTIFDWVTPGTVDGGDGNSVELGVKFKSDVAGSVTGHPLLQGGGQYRDARRRAVDHRWDTARGR